MATPRPLARAPIIEALIDFRVQAADGVSVQQLEKTVEVRDFGYHKKGPILRGHFGLMVNPQSVPMAQPMASETTIIGVRLHSANEKYIAQFTTEGFTLSRLAPYESWEALIEETKRVWEVYRACAKPARIQRTAARFINNLRLPMQSGERFEKFLTGLPAMPPDFPQTISSFLQRFIVQDEPSGATAILTQALDQVTTLTSLPVILDIDVYRETNFARDSPDVWSYLTVLRILKNRFFFGSLTEAAVELYA
jgi:uncharacterized protein (TIGR04255 family)